MNYFNTSDERSKAPLSIVRGINPKVIAVSTVGDVLLDIKAQDKQKASDLCDAYKNDRAAYKKLKDGLHGFIAGAFTKRDAESCTQYVPLIVLDIDGVRTDDDAHALFKSVSEIEYTYACFLSPSGHGLRILVWSDNGENGHESAYSKVTAVYSERIGVKTDTELKVKGSRLVDGEHFDTSAKAFPRFWYYSYNDEFLFINENAETFSLDVNAPKKGDPSVKKAIQLPKSEPSEVLTDAMIIELVTDMVSRNASSGRNNHVFNFACLAVENGLSEDVIADHCLSFEEKDFGAAEIAASVKSAIGRTKRKYDDAQVMAAYRKLKGDVTPSVQKSAVNVQVVTFPKKADPGASNKKIDYRATGQHQGMKGENRFVAMCLYLDRKYAFRFNEVANEGEIKFKKADKFEPLNMSGLECELMEYGLGGCDKMLKAYLGSPNYCPVFDPFAEYFKGLPKWDGKDHILHLSSFVITEDGTEWWHKMFRKALLRTAACALLKTQNRNCLTLFGGQNAGKSRFIRFLVPPALKLYYKEGLSNPQSKDGKLEIVQNFIINLDDLDGKSKWDVGQLKSLFSLASVKERPFFGTSPRLFDRRCSFFASSNKDDILVDESGSTRWNIVKVKTILHDNGGDKGYTKSVDITQLWAQVYDAINQGEKYDLTSDEMNASEEKNKDFQKTSHEQELILKYLEHVPDDAEAFMLASEIKTELEKVAGLHYSLNINNIGRALSLMKIEKFDKRVERFKYSMKGYRVRLNPKFAAREPEVPFTYMATNPPPMTFTPSVKTQKDDVPF
jgi:hypothetical protein